MDVAEAKQIAKLHKPDAFIREFHRQQKIHRTNPEAYQAVEAKYIKLFGEPKYTSFKSFETVFYRRINRKLQQRKKELNEIRKRVPGKEQRPDHTKTG